jgi:hypothetical protein
MADIAPSELHQQILNQLRRYSASSVVEAAMRLLSVEYPTQHEGLMLLPWHILLLVKWALRDERVSVRIGRRITPQEFDGLRREVQELVGKDFLAKKPPVYLMMRSHFPQFEFQRPEGLGFLRWPALIARQGANHPSRRQFVQVLGLPPEHFIDLTFSLMAAVTGERTHVPHNYFQPVHSTYGESIDAFWRLIAYDLPALRRALQEDAKATPIPLRQELYEFPHLKQYPFFKARNGDFCPWHRMVTARGLEEIVHIRLSRLGSQYTEPFSRLFEQYVTELAQEMSSDCVTETAYATLAGSSAPKVEAILPFGDCLVLVEAKMALFGDDVLLTDNELQAFQKTKRVRDGIKQAWKVGKAIRGPQTALPHYSNANQDFLLVVTSRELGLGSGEQQRRLYPRGSLEYPDNDARQNLPLENVFSMSIQEFERLSAAVARGDIRLPHLLKDAVQKNRNPQTSAILFDHFIGQHVRNWGSPSLLIDARNAAQQRLAIALDVPEREFSAVEDADPTSDQR